MTPLPLSGQAKAIAGFTRGNQPRSVLRLCDAQGPGPVAPNDVAIARSAVDVGAAEARGFQALLAIGEFEFAPATMSYIQLGTQFDYLSDGDIIGVDVASRRLRSLYRKSSEHNSFLVTERCDHLCLMCSQPPRDVDDSWIIDEIREALSLIPPSTRGIGFTGGEPLLEWRRFLPLIGQMRDELPDTAVHVLTNGRAFSRPEVAAAWADLRHPDLCAGIPVYSCVDVVHDHVVQSKGAFDETILGILRMKDRGQRVEVRLVVHKLTAPGLVATCEWFARNLPFVDHIALMGLENTGFALANQDELWIDPVDYQADLALGLDILTAAHISVSIYNLPLCLLPHATWPYAKQSISDWKRAFPPACTPCIRRNDCGGFFSTGRPRLSRGIRPFTDTLAG